MQERGSDSKTFRQSKLRSVEAANGIYSCQTEVMSVETEWGQALFGCCNCLAHWSVFAQSLQSIMGARLTFLSIFNMFNRILEVTFQDISALLL